MATIGIFLEARDDVEPYPYIDKAICLWRYHEEQVRKDCNLPSVETYYPGCFNYNHKSGATSPVRADSSNSTRTRTRTRRKLVMDNDATEEEMEIPLHLDPEEFRPHDYTEEEWAAFQEEYSKQHPVDSPNRWSNSTTTRKRRLIDYEHVPHFNYQFLLDVRTEYYFRYKGTTTYPPCYGKHGGTSDGSNARTNHWRIMKDPIRIHTRQLKEMVSLLFSHHLVWKNRIVPLHSPLRVSSAPFASRTNRPP